LALVQRGLATGEASVVEAALETGLILGLRAAWTHCRRQLESPDPVSRLACWRWRRAGAPGTSRR
ncbi:hypothetical protein ACLESO_35325, partial [Pyxidicoccus sp. 3LG]